MIYTFIKNHECEFPIGIMCKVLDVSSSSYYAWKRSPVSHQKLRKQRLKSLIMEYYFEFKQKYGSPRIAAELNARGHKVSRLTVARYMRELGLRSKLAKRFKVTTDSKHNYLIVDNLLNRKFKQSQPAKAWVSDITYIAVKEGFIYLTIVMDLYDRKLIGWSLSRSMCTQHTTLSAFHMARKNRPFQAGLIFHSDQGVQYANNVFANVLESYKVERSMSRKGNCWDNAVAESFFKSLKTELVYGNLLTSASKMEKMVFQYIELWYNKIRRHSFLDYKTIEEFNKKSDKYKNVA